MVRYAPAFRRVPAQAHSSGFIHQSKAKNTVHVGGDEAKQFDGQYGGVLIPDGPNVEAELLRYWGPPSND